MAARISGGGGQQGVVVYHEVAQCPQLKPARRWLAEVCGKVVPQVTAALSRSGNQLGPDLGRLASRRRYLGRPARVLVRYCARHPPSARPAAVAAGRLAGGQSYREER